jgi:NAD(P)-dependent dehydrogenase (short-subunit alcohol dehydrogenase family)
MFLELPGRVAIVTGAARGIGFAIAERLSRAGAHLVIADVIEEGATAAVERLHERGAKLLRRSQTSPFPRRSPQWSSVP